MWYGANGKHGMVMCGMYWLRDVEPGCQAGRQLKVDSVLHLSVTLLLLAITASLGDLLHQVLLD